MNLTPDYLPASPPDQKLSQPSSLDGWILIGLFIVMTIVLLIAGGAGAKVLSIAFPLGTFVVAWFLYFRYPILYIGFVWWSIFLVAFVRRIADFRLGAFTDSSPILLAPYLAILVSANTLYLNLPKVKEKGTLPFLLALASVMYAYCIALLYPGMTLVKATLALLNWIAPILWGFYAYINWQRYPEYSRVIRRVFVWGALIMGLYGIYQYIVVPEWEKLWLLSSGMDSSSGTPVPYGLRVWSTLNSFGVYADVIATVLLVLPSCSSPLVAPAAIAGGLSLLFTSVRTGWIAWFVGFIFMVSFLKTKQKIRLLVGLLIISLVMIPVVSMEPFSTNLSKRFNTLSDLENDDSAQVRQRIYQDFFKYKIYNVLGDGLGVLEIADSGPMSLIVDLGWVGAIPYAGGLLLCLISLFQKLKNYSDLFIKSCCGVLLKCSVIFLATRNTTGAPGVLLWGFLGIAMAGQKYIQHSQTHNLIQDLRTRQIQ
jgi:hypothetical protein